MKKDNIIPFPNLIKDADLTTFKDFAQSVVSGQTKKASLQLQLLLELDIVKATAATNHYTRIYQSNPQESLQITMGIRSHILSNDNNKALISIITLFGFDGPEALSALEIFREKV